jgi:hypothetical protein
VVSEDCGYAAGVGGSAESVAQTIVCHADFLALFRGGSHPLKIDKTIRDPSTPNLLREAGSPLRMTAPFLSLASVVKAFNSC